MKDLSKDTVSTIVNALIDTRLDALKFLDGAARAGHVEHQALMQKWLGENAAAFRELNQEVAPWLQYHPQLRDVFEERARTEGRDRHFKNSNLKVVEYGNER